MIRLQNVVKGKTASSEHAIQSSALPVDRCPPKCDCPTVTGTADTLPDFFPGAHVQLMRRKLAAADSGRFRPYFPKVQLKGVAALM